MQKHARFKQNKDEWDRPTGIILHKDATSSIQGDYDSSSIRMFEERMATEQNGDWLSGSRDSQKAVGKFIIETAKANDFNKRKLNKVKRTV